MLIGQKLKCCRVKLINYDSKNRAIGGRDLD